jgi:hypothetical protein
MSYVYNAVPGVSRVVFRQVRDHISIKRNITLKDQDIHCVKCITRPDPSGYASPRLGTVQIQHDLNELGLAPCSLGRVCAHGPRPAKSDPRTLLSRDQSRSASLRLGTARIQQDPLGSSRIQSDSVSPTPCSLSTISPPMALSGVRAHTSSDG